MNRKNSRPIAIRISNELYDTLKSSAESLDSTISTLANEVLSVFTRAIVHDKLILQCKHQVELSTTNKDAMVIIKQFAEKGLSKDELAAIYYSKYPKQ